MREYMKEDFDTFKVKNGNRFSHENYFPCYKAFLSFDKKRSDVLSLNHPAYYFKNYVNVKNENIAILTYGKKLHELPFSIEHLNNNSIFKPFLTQSRSDIIKDMYLKKEAEVYLKGYSTYLSTIQDEFRIQKNLEFFESHIKLNRTDILNRDHAWAHENIDLDIKDADMLLSKLITKEELDLYLNLYLDIEKASTRIRMLHISNFSNVDKMSSILEKQDVLVKKIILNELTKNPHPDADLALRFSLPLRPIFGFNLNLEAEKPLTIPKIKSKSLEPDVVTDIVNKLVQDVSEALDLENYKNEILRSLNLIPTNKQSKNLNGPKDLGYGVEEACGHNHWKSDSERFVGPPLKNAWAPTCTTDDLEAFWPIMPHTAADHAADLKAELAHKAKMESMGGGLQTGISNILKGVFGSKPVEPSLTPIKEEEILVPSGPQIIKDNGSGTGLNRSLYENLLSSPNILNFMDLIYNHMFENSVPISLWFVFTFIWIGFKWLMCHFFPFLKEYRVFTLYSIASFIWKL